MIITHRGNYNGLQENTLRAFDAALNAGADAVECDLRLTKDNKIVVNHDSVSRILLKDLGNILALDELFEYIKQKRVPFFLEVKSSSPILIEEIAKRIKQKNLWSQVHIIGFSIFIKNALLAQAKYSKLRVIPIINFPLYSYLKLPTKSYGVFVGWIDEWYGSEWLFRKLISTNRLIKLKKFYEDKGFKVMAGVINKKQGFEYFKKAGIVDIVTDNIKDAVNYFKTRRHSGNQAKPEYPESPIV